MKGCRVGSLFCDYFILVLLQCSCKGLKGTVQTDVVFVFFITTLYQTLLENPTPDQKVVCSNHVMSSLWAGLWSNYWACNSRLVVCFLAGFLSGPGPADQ